MSNHIWVEGISDASKAEQARILGAIAKHQNKKENPFQDTLTKFWWNFGYHYPDNYAPLCNFCGESCILKGEFLGTGGLINTNVTGGYNSTPGNGEGALDDLTNYNFSICEFCLDFIFSQMKIPPKVHNCVVGPYEPKLILEEEIPYRSASQRVKEDEWRRMKDRFYEEWNKRAGWRIENEEK